MPVYQIRYFLGGNTHHTAHKGDSHGTGKTGGSIIKPQLADARTGQLLSPIKEAEAVAIAKRNVAGLAEVEKGEYKTEVCSLH